MQEEEAFSYGFYGLAISADVALPGLPPDTKAGKASQVRLERCPARFSFSPGALLFRDSYLVEGVPFVEIVLSSDGTVLRMEYAGGSVFFCQLMASVSGIGSLPTWAPSSLRCSWQAR